MTTSQCGAPVVVAGVFSSVDSDTGHTCVRLAGHDGGHRWTAAWAALSPEQVEEGVARDAAWDVEDAEDAED